jgi:hypothetical protein
LLVQFFQQVTESGKISQSFEIQAQSLRGLPIFIYRMRHKKKVATSNSSLKLLSLSMSYVFSL